MSWRDCAVNTCMNQSDKDCYVTDEEGNTYRSCESCNGDEYDAEDLDSEKKECKTCKGEGVIEYGPECNKPMSQCCGGCFREEPCPDCGDENFDDEPTDDYDEAAAWEAEVEWESPE